MSGRTDSDDSLSFMMGEFRAEFPLDRQYAKNHMWAMSLEDGPVPDGRYRLGFSAYAVRLLQDVYFLDWVVDANSEVAERQEIGQIESQKAEASLYCPMAGKIVAINEELLNDPSAINVDKYDTGWLLEIAGKGDMLLSPNQYLSHLDAVWKITQQTIKGQMNE